MNVGSATALPTMPALYVGPTTARSSVDAVAVRQSSLPDRAALAYVDTEMSSGALYRPRHPWGQTVSLVIIGAPSELVRTA